MDAVDWKDWMPPALVYFKKFKSQPKLVSEFLKRLERVSYYLLITIGGFNARLEKFRSLIEAIQRDDFDGDSSKLEAMHLSDKEMKDFREALNGDIYSKLPKARAALVLSLEKLMNDQSAIFEYRNVQIEHILPQRPAKNSDWLTLFADQEIRDDWTHRIANLAPLYSRKNPAASNYDFNKKKEVYFFGKDNTTSPFALINNLRGVEVWTPEVLEKRQKMLLDKLYKHWELN
ncbi:HNH endonuclease family protein [Brucella thiophenivorans]|uniref:GmrSD restriction endonucleases C-terminal domain-containing protein n=1 Tax=Brucella thiophenivorans TaxID=571255 RepID=A0A256FNC1_9HYPH|nr:HNH endonuclease family protein [Brucella thiophenivorans]OYR16258.1 hypothetical protein CEV31_4407 [Brucella thiophenivorans]